MLQIPKKLLCAMLCLSLISALSACGAKKTAIKVRPDSIETAESGTISENERFLLEWDDEQKCILLREKATESVWSTVPYGFFLENDTNQNLSSPIFISYYNPTDGSVMVSRALNDCIEKDNLSVAVRNGSIEMEFYFENAQITVPLTVSLTDDGLYAEIRAADIKESGKTMLISVSVFPYLCSAENVTDRSNYLFLPVGSGALMYTDPELQENSRTYNGEVYGTDAARRLLEHTEDEEAIKLPVFGAVNGENALFAIIDGSEETATISADAGNIKNGYSTVYASFNMRGFDETEVERSGYSDALIYAKKYDKNAVYSVSYYPLNGENADYNGMANFYRDYLKKSKGIIRSSQGQQPLQLSFLGGAQIRDVFAGIPYKRLEPATSLSEVKDISEEIYREIGEKPSILLKGFLSSGTDIGKIGGALGFSSQLGGKKGYSRLEEYCKDNGFPLYNEYDPVRFCKSSAGYSLRLDTALTAGKQLASFYPLKKNIRSDDETGTKYNLIKREKLERSVERLLKRNEGVTGISYSVLGDTAYSDYSDADCYMKAGMAAQVRKLIVSSSESGHTVGVSAANGYAAGVADTVSYTPMNNGKYYSFDCSIPFYQMLFRGNSALYTPPLNLEADPYGAALRAISFGVAPSFVLTKHDSSKLAESLSPEYYGSVYNDDSLRFIKQIAAKTSALFSALEFSEINSYSLSENGVARTEFSNGMVVFVNPGDTFSEAYGIGLEGKSFCFISEGGTVNVSMTGGEE